MKNFNYKLLSGLYYNRYDEYLELYNKRIHSPEYVPLDFTIADSPAFFLETSELMKTVVEIARLDKEIAKLSALLPKIALQQYINKCLIDEIVITNNIEGVYSTRKEIGEILDDLEGKSKNRFFGLVNKYAALQSKEDLSINTSQDIRNLYDEMFLSEIREEDPKDVPDGQIFRKDHVDVVSATQRVIHHGAYPESEIIRSMDKAIKILNAENIEPLFRIAIFHYLFGYIHPFYNGNGRLNRFISSYYLAHTLEPIMGYRLSYTIKENINRYYKSFRIVNDKKNKGDITPFIFTYLDFIKESSITLKEKLEEKANALKYYSKSLESLPYGNDDKYRTLYFYLLQAALFSEIGISTNDLLQYLQISRPTLQKRLHLLDESGLLITMRRETNKFYQLNLDKLPFKGQVPGSLER